MDLKKTSANEVFEPTPMAGKPTVAAVEMTPGSKLLGFLDNLGKLPTDWDGEGALKPDDAAVSDAKGFVRSLFLNYPNMKIEQACAGPVGEIVIELRENEKSLEFLFYPNKKWKYVSIGGKRPPEQGVFEQKNLSKLITWLHETE